MNTRKETWRDVPSIPHLQASSRGRVRSTYYEQPMPSGGVRRRCLAPTFGQWTGTRFIFRFRGKTYKVARAVCEAFHGPPPADANLCLHEDEKSANNKPANLSWGTQKENLNYPGFLTYCRSRTGDENPYRKGRA